jgi:hypothetical protein
MDFIFGQQKLWFDRRGSRRHLLARSCRNSLINHPHFVSIPHFLGSQISSSFPPLPL